MNIKWHVVVSLLILNASTSIRVLGQDSSSDKLLDSICTELRTEEQNLKNIKIHAKSNSETWETGKKSWVPSNETEMEVTLDGRAGGKVRVNCLRELDPWTNSDTPFLLTEYTATYNGTISAIHFTKRGDFTKAGKISKGEISGSRIIRIDGAVDSIGWRQSIFGVGEPRDENKSFSEMLDQSLAGQKIDSMKIENSDGSSLIQVIRITPTSKTLYILDASRGYAITQKKSYSPTKLPNGKFDYEHSTKVESHSEMSSFIEPVKGLFFPTKVTGEVSFADGTPGMKGTVTVLDVTMNDNSVTDHTFELEFPKGTHVIDRDTNNEFIVGGSSSEQANAIESEVEKAKAILSTPTTMESK